MIKVDSKYKKPIFKEFISEIINQPYVAIPYFMEVVEETFNKSRK
jgi:hypothetical protein